MSGHYFAATSVPRADLVFLNDNGLKWRKTSKTSKRGFCGECGSFLFFDHGPDEPISVSSGSLDDASGMHLAAHIFVDQAGDYYSLSDEVPRFTQRQWLDEKGWQTLRHGSEA